MSSYLNRYLPSSLHQRHDLGTESHPSAVFFTQSDLAHTPGTRTVGNKNSYQFPIFNLPGINQEATPALRCLPLRTVSLEVQVTSTIARSTLTQNFLNPSEGTIREAHYSFPLYNGAAIVSFRCLIGNDKVLEGQIKARAEAKTDIQEAVADQKAVALLEEHTPEIFQTSLGNIPANSAVRIEISYVEELKADLGGEGVLVTIPTSIAPRYGQSPVDVPSAQHVSEETGLHIAVSVATTVPIRKLECSTHPISVEMGVDSFAELANSSINGSPPCTVNSDFSKRARATLSDRRATLGRDFVLLILSAKADLLKSQAILERPLNEGGESALMITLKSRLNTIRFFALGIGGQVSHHLIAGIGSRGGGFGEVVPIDGQGQWHRNVIRMLQGAMMPESWQCHIRLEGFPEYDINDSKKRDPNYVRAPYQEIALHPFTRYSVFFLIKDQDDTFPKTVNITASTSEGHETCLNLLIEMVDTKIPIVHHLAAKAFMLGLASGESSLHSWYAAQTLGSNQYPIGQVVKEEAGKIGKMYCIPSKWTSFVAVQGSITMGKEIRTYVANRVATSISPSVSLNMYRPSLGSSKRYFGGDDSIGNALVLNSAKQSSIVSRERHSDYIFNRDLRTKEFYRHRYPDKYDQEVYVASEEEKQQREFRALIAAEHADGSFVFCNSHPVYLRFIPDIRSTIKAHLQDGNSVRDMPTLCDTIVAIFTIWTVFAGLREKWELLIRKAIRWVMKVLAGSESTFMDLIYLLKEKWTGDEAIPPLDALAGMVPSMAPILSRTTP